MTKFALLPFALVLVASPLMAQTAAAPETMTAIGPIKTSDIVVSADGRRLGRVDSSRGGQVKVIYNGRFVSIPAVSLSRENNRLTSTLKFNEIVR